MIGPTLMSSPVESGSNAGGAAVDARLLILVPIFAERRRRGEDVAFQAFFAAYRWGHRLLTGMAVRVGNFSIVPAAQLERIVVVSELWNHYAAAVFQAGLPHETIPTRRLRRLTGA